MTVHVKPKVDVLVAGGGTSGIVAALAAARSGARTLLVEQNGYVGGVAGMGLPLQGLFNNRAERIVGGIPWEIVMRLRAIGAAADVRNVAIGEPRGRGSNKFNARFIAYHPEALKAIALEMLHEAGVELLLHTFITDVVMDGPAVAGVIVENKSGRTIIPASRIVDCTGDGDVAARAGAPFEKGRPGDGALQPMTLLFTMTNIDLDRAKEAGVFRWEYAFDGPPEWGPETGSYRVMLTRWAKEIAREFPDFAPLLKGFSMWYLSNGVFTCGNMLHIPGLDASDGDQLTRAEIDARRMVWRLGQFLRKHVPGYENAYIVGTQAHIGIRESRRIMGEYCLTHDDVVEGRTADDVVALCGYRVDIHDYQGSHDYNEPSRGVQVKDYGSYDIPYRCLVPQRTEHLLVAGRCISATHEAQGSCRVMGTAMALGQAAGVASALSLQHGVSPRALDHHLLQKTLLGQGVYLGDRFAPLDETAGVAVPTR